MGPAEAAPVADLGHHVGRLVQAGLGLRHVAGQERGPRPVLLDPRQPAAVGQAGVDLLRLVEERLGTRGRHAEHLDEPAPAQGTRELGVVAELAPQAQRLVELHARPIDVAFQALHLAEQAMRGGGAAPIVVAERGRHHRLEVGAALGQPAEVGRGVGAHEQQAPPLRPHGQALLALEQVDPAVGQPVAGARIHLFGRPLGGLGEPAHGALVDVAGDRGHPPDLAHDLGRRRPVVGEVLDRRLGVFLHRLATPPWRWARAALVSVW